MKKFEFVDARSAGHALELTLRYRGQGKRCEFFATGADILYLRKDWIEGPAMPTAEVLINLGQAKDKKDMEGIDDRGDGGVAIGAMTRLIDLIESSTIQWNYTLLAHAATHISSPNSAIPAPSQAIFTSGPVAGTSEIRT